MQKQALTNSITRIGVIAKREWQSYFQTSIGYIVLAVFTCGAALLFLQTLVPGSPATLRPTYASLVWFLGFMIPALSMKLFSDEYRGGTIELLMTMPFRRMEVVVGKWLGGVVFLSILLSPLLLLAFLLHFLSSPDVGLWAVGWIGLMLVGILYLAIGLFASSLTENQFVAYTLSVFLIALLTVGTGMLAYTDIAPSLRELLFAMNINTRYEEFNRGLISISSLVFFISLTVFCLYLCVETLRWRFSTQ